MERILWIYMPFLLATLFTITGYVTGFPTPQINSTDIVTDLVEVQSTTSHVSESSTAQPLLQYSVTNLPVFEVPTSLPNQNGDALNQTGNSTSLSLTLSPTYTPVATTTTISPATTTTPSETTATPPATTTTPIPVVTISEAIATLPHTVSPVHSTTKFVTTVTTALPTTTTTLHPATIALTSTTTQTTTQPMTVKTSATPAIIPVHETTLEVAKTPTASTPQEATTASKSTHIPDKQTTKESGDWSIIGITSNSFTGKILLPIAVGGALSVIIIAVAYCYCSRRGSRGGSAKPSRNGVQAHRMTSNDRVMLLADSSEDEF